MLTVAYLPAALDLGLGIASHAVVSMESVLARLSDRFDLLLSLVPRLDMAGNKKVMFYA